MAVHYDDVDDALATLTDQMVPAEVPSALLPYLIDLFEKAQFPGFASALRAEEGRRRERVHCCGGRWNGAGVECDDDCRCAECLTWRDDDTVTPTSTTD